MKSSATDAATVIVHVPMTFTIRGGRKRIISAAGETTDARGVLTTSHRQAPQRTENALLKALARANRWQRMIEDGKYASITELARTEGLNESYACRVLRLNLLAPSIVTDVLNGRCSSELMLKSLMTRLPVQWDGQKAILRCVRRISA